MAERWPSSSNAFPRAVRQSDGEPKSMKASQQAIEQTTQQTSTKSPFSIDDYRAQVIRLKCGKFRILIIGRANAGKTTILQRTCDTMDDPVIYNRKGQEVRNYSTHQSMLIPANFLYIDSP